MMDSEQLAREVEIGAWPEQRSGMHVGLVKGIKVTHKPTGIVVICDTERSQHKNREKALQFIARALEQPAQEDGATIHSCSPYCERPECVRERGEDEQVAVGELTPERIEYIAGAVAAAWPKKMEERSKRCRLAAAALRALIPLATPTKERT